MERVRPLSCADPIIVNFLSQGWREPNCLWKTPESDYSCVLYDSQPITAHKIYFHLTKFLQQTFASYTLNALNPVLYSGHEVQNSAG